MNKPLLFYESAAPLTTARHAAVSLETGNDYAFSANTNAVPVMAVEFAAAAAEYAIVFAASADAVLPVAVLGVRPDRNLYLSADASWQAKYIPAFVRRYPFVFSASADGKTLTLCIDEAHPGVNREGRGVRLFGNDARPSAYVQQVFKFLQDYHVHFERTKAFGKRLQELGLLEPMQAQIRPSRGEPLALGRFMVVSRTKLRALDGQSLSLLARTDELELAYLHLHSLRNFGDVTERVAAAEQGAQAPAEAQA